MRKEYIIKSKPRYFPDRSKSDYLDRKKFLKKNTLIKNIPSILLRI